MKSVKKTIWICIIILFLSLLFFQCDGGVKIAGYNINIEMVSDINHGGSSNPAYFVIYQNELYFQADDGQNRLFSYNGYDSIYPAYELNEYIGSYPEYLTIYNDSLYFSANNSANNFVKDDKELFKYRDGDIIIKADIWPGEGGSLPRSLVVFNNQLYFAARSEDTYGYEIYRYWEDYGGPMYERITSISFDGNSIDSRADNLIVFNSRLYFAASVIYSTNELDLRYINKGETTVNNGSNIIMGEDDNIENITVFGNKLYMVVGGNSIYDDNDTNIKLESEIPFEPAINTEMFVYNNKLYFSAKYGSAGYELWEYDGSSDFKMAYDINKNGDSNPSSFGAYYNNLFFSADNGSDGRELWMYDGINTPEMVADINPDGSSDPQEMIVFNGCLFFSADDGDHGRELWSLSLDR